tara:strand:- start:406 stop:603 length:198 start_codon:yes stop_codon:yes gene_type:complete
MQTRTIENRHSGGEFLGFFGNLAFIVATPFVVSAAVFGGGLLTAVVGIPVAVTVAAIDTIENELK